MQVSKKALKEQLVAIADAIASADVDQEDRERVARAVGDSLSRVVLQEFDRDVFVLLASDPLVPCVGADGEGCPHERVIRIPMHLSSAPDGRSKVWAQRAPYGDILCVTCGSEKYVKGYKEGREREAARRAS